jgi:plastocyanin
MIANPVRCLMMALATAALLAADVRAQPTSAADPNVIVMKNFHFAPVTLNIPVGATVTWKNLDEEPHTVASDSGVFRSGGLQENDTFGFKFDKPGTYNFICSIHPNMMGKIVVK